MNFKDLLRHTGHNIEVVTRGDPAYVAQVTCETCDTTLYTESVRHAETNPTPIVLVYTTADRKKSLDLDISSWVATQNDNQLQTLRSRFKRHIEALKMMLLDHYVERPEVQDFVKYLDANPQDVQVRAETQELYAWVEAHREYLMKGAG